NKNKKNGTAKDNNNNFYNLTRLLDYTIQCIPTEIRQALAAIPLPLWTAIAIPAARSLAILRHPCRLAFCSEKIDRVEINSKHFIGIPPYDSKTIGIKVQS